METKPLSLRLKEEHVLEHAYAAPRHCQLKTQQRTGQLKNPPLKRKQLRTAATGRQINANEKPRRLVSFQLGRASTLPTCKLRKQTTLAEAGDRNGCPQHQGRQGGSRRPELTLARLPSCSPRHVTPRAWAQSSTTTRPCLSQISYRRSMSHTCRLR